MHPSQHGVNLPTSAVDGLADDVAFKHSRNDAAQRHCVHVGLVKTQYTWLLAAGVHVPPPVYVYPLMTNSSTPVAVPVEP